MDYVMLVLLLVVAVLLCFLLLCVQKLKATRRAPSPRFFPEYDCEGYNRHGYNALGRNRQGKYNRLYNVKCYQSELYSEEGFLSIRRNPLYLTNHARDRIRERMGIFENREMDALAFEAYQFGKSKLQLMKSERAFVEEKEQKYGNSVILFYRGFCYVFTENNGLITVYKNNSVRT